jgi:hypothetical protein
MSSCSFTILRFDGPDTFVVMRAISCNTKQMRDIRDLFRNDSGVADSSLPRIYSVISQPDDEH